LLLLLSRKITPTFVFKQNSSRCPRYHFRSPACGSAERNRRVHGLSLSYRRVGVESLAH